LELFPLTSPSAQIMGTAGVWSRASKSLLRSPEILFVSAIDINREAKGEGEESIVDRVAGVAEKSGLQYEGQTR